MPRATTVDDHGIGGVVECLNVDALGDGGVPVVDVEGHRAAVRMGKPDAVGRRQVGLGLKGVVLNVPARGAWPLGARWDGHKAPAVSDVGVN